MSHSLHCLMNKSAQYDVMVFCHTSGILLYWMMGELFFSDWGDLFAIKN